MPTTRSMAARSMAGSSPPPPPPPPETTSRARPNTRKRGSKQAPPLEPLQPAIPASNGGRVPRARVKVVRQPPSPVKPKVKGKRVAAAAKKYVGKQPTLLDDSTTSEEEEQLFVLAKVAPKGKKVVAVKIIKENARNLRPRGQDGKISREIEGVDLAEFARSCRVVAEPFVDAVRSFKAMNGIVDEKTEMLVAKLTLGAEEEIKVKEKESKIAKSETVEPVEVVEDKVIGEVEGESESIEEVEDESSGDEGGKEKQQRKRSLDHMSADEYQSAEDADVSQGAASPAAAARPKSSVNLNNLTFDFIGTAANQNVHVQAAKKLILDRDLVCDMEVDATSYFSFVEEPPGTAKNISRSNGGSGSSGICNATFIKPKSMFTASILECVEEDEEEEKSPPRGGKQPPLQSSTTFSLELELEKSTSSTTSSSASFKSGGSTHNHLIGTSTGKNKGPFNFGGGGGAGNNPFSLTALDSYTKKVQDAQRNKEENLKRKQELQKKKNEEWRQKAEKMKVEQEKKVTQKQQITGSSTFGAGGAGAAAVAFSSAKPPISVNKLFKPPVLPAVMRPLEMESSSKPSGPMKPHFKPQIQTHPSVQSNISKPLPALGSGMKNLIKSTVSRFESAFKTPNTSASFLDLTVHDAAGNPTSYDITIYEDLDEEMKHRENKHVPAWATNSNEVSAQLFKQLCATHIQNVPHVIFPSVPLHYKLFPFLHDRDNRF